MAPMIMGIGCRRLRAHAAQRCLEVALGIDQEVGPRDHGLSLAQPFKHFKKAVCPSAGEQFARLEATLTQGDQCDLPSAAVDHRRVGNREHGCALPSSQLGSAKHGRLEQAVGIGQLDTNLYSAGLRREIGVDEGHLASEMAAWIGADRELYRLPRFYQRQVLLEYLSDKPDGIEVRNSVESVPGLEAHAFQRRFVQYDPIHRSGDRQGTAGFAGTAQALKLCFANIPVA